MTSTAVTLAPLPRPERWHRPLLWFTASMIVLGAASAVLAIVDPSEINGQNAWFKPLKFALSFTIYSPTLAWLIGLLRRHRRIGHIAGTVAAIASATEMIIITWAAAVGTTSHFNVSSPLHTTLWAIMAWSVVVIWLMTLTVGITVLFNPTGDPARDLTIRAAVIIGLIGMAQAFFMTFPTEDQLNDPQGFAGAHAVGAPEDGPGLPLLGWSTIGGDLRVGHFIGMHGLQAIPLFTIGLEWASRRLPLLRNVTTRVRLIAVAATSFTALVVIVTWQALLGQSVIAPAGPILLALASLIAVTAATVAVVLLSAGRRTTVGD